MGERVKVATLLEELEDDFDAAFCWVGSGHPAEYDIRRALCTQRKEYVLKRLRTLLKGQEFVNLPDALEPGSKGEPWRREDWAQVEEDREDEDR